ncbi:MAG: T9SS type A sorting domain-containing protein [Bacteroidota bacterium]
MKKTYTKAMKLTNHLLFALALLLLMGSQTAQAQCDNDTIRPSVIAPTDTTISCVEFAALNIDAADTSGLRLNFGFATAMDNCPGAYSVELPPTIHVEVSCGAQTIRRRFAAVDDAGNVSPIVEQSITVIPGSDVEIQLPADSPLGDTLETYPESTFGDCVVSASIYQDLVFDYDCDGLADKIIRTWTIVDWCVDPPLTLNLERLDLDGDMQDGDPYTIKVIGDSTYRMEAGVPVETLGPAASLFTYNQIIIRSDPDSLNSLIVSGQVFNDDGNCQLDSGEPGLANWDFEIVGGHTGRIYPLITDAQGRYSVELCESDSSFSVRMQVPFNYVGNCISSYNHQLPDGSTNFNLDIPVALESGCPLLYVDIAAPRLRRCFDNAYYVQYCNYSDQVIPGASVEVELDNYMTYLGSTIPGSLLQGTTWSFPLGDLDPGACGDFQILFNLSCDAALGQTHCVTAHVYPDTLCEAAAANWSGASIEVDGFCDGDTVRMNISNIGTGDMAAPLNYIVVEDVLMRADGEFDLNSGQTMPLPLVANGATWYLTAEQEPGHPGESMPAIAIEGCGGLNDPGLATAFVQNDANPFVSIDCQDNIGAYDPNDKQVSPTGVGERHLVPANTHLDYLIRFQNTGTDTAFNVVIVDTLSPLLDQATIVPGVSSHAYTFDYPEANIIRFVFDNIMLPDSNVNEPASNGFVKFSIDMQPDLPDDSRIENSAAIYFDFNEPIITNTTFLTIGEEIFGGTTSSQEIYKSGASIKMTPNPAHLQTSVQIDGIGAASGQVVVYDLNGRALLQQNFNTTSFNLNLGKLKTGIYIYECSTMDGELIGTGKLAVF